MIFPFRYLLAILDVKDKAVRFRGCQLLSGILNNLGPEAELECVNPLIFLSHVSFLNSFFLISDRIWDSLLHSLLKRCTDKVVCIRVWAVTALSRLQGKRVVQLKFERKINQNDKILFVSLIVFSQIRVQKKILCLTCTKT